MKVLGHCIDDGHQQFWSEARDVASLLKDNVMWDLYWSNRWSIFTSVVLTVMGVFSPWFGLRCCLPVIEDERRSWLHSDHRFGICLLWCAA